MDGYISKEYLIARFKELANDYYTGEKRQRGLAYATAADMVALMKSADVQPVKKGHWYHNTSKYISELDAYFIQACCSCCGRYSDRIDNYSQIMTNETCSHCGARMDGDAE
jgi:hypothetical protein